MATAEDGGATTSFAYENGGGAGGKFRKRPFRRYQTTTPYDRPPTALRKPNWLTKLVVDPATKLINSGAQRFFSSLFQKRLPEASQESKALPQKSRPDDHARAAVGAAPEVSNAACSSEGNAFTELEKLLEQKTLSRAEIDCLTELLRSKAVDTPPGNDKKAEALYYRPLPNFSSSSLENNRSEKVTFDAAVATPVTSSRVPKDNAASPAELANWYMVTRQSNVLPSAQSSLSQMVRVDTPLPKDVAYPQILPVITSATRKTAGLVGVRPNGFLTPRSHGRTAIYNMARTPYSRIRQTDLQMASSSRNSAYGGPSSSESVVECDGYFGSNRSLKRRSSVLEADLGSVGPMRRTRQKPNLLANGVSHPSPGAGVASSAVAHSDALKVVGGSEDNTIMPTRYAHIPSKSGETATKILEHLENLTPKKKPPESKVAKGKDKTPEKLTSNMLHGRALKSTESFDSPKLLQSAEDIHKLENWSKAVPVHNSSLQKQGKILQNGQKKLYEPTVVAKKDAEVSFKDAQQGVEIAVSLDKRSAAQPQKKHAFRMSAPEDFFDLDEGIDTDGSESLLAEGRDKMGTSGAEKKSLSTDETLIKSATFLATKAPLGILNKRNDMEALDASVTSVKNSSSLPSADPLLPEVITPSFGSDKSKESNVDKVPAFLSSSSPPLTGLKPESSSSLSNSAGPAGAPSKLFESDNLQKDGKSNCRLEDSSSGLPLSILVAAPSSSSSFSVGQFSASPAISATAALASIDVPKDVQFGSSCEIAPSTGISATVGSTAGTATTSCSSLFGSTAASPVSTDPIFKFASGEVPSIGSVVPTTSSADNTDVKIKTTNFDNLNNNSPFAGSTFVSASPANSRFGFSSSGMSTVTTTNFQSESSVFSTGGQLLARAQTSIAGSDNATVSQSASAHFGSSTSSPEVGNSGMTSFSSAGSASSDTAIVSAASSNSNLAGSSTAASVNFGLSSSASFMMGSSVIPSSGIKLAFTFGASPAISTAVTTTLPNSSNTASGMFSFGVNSSSSSTNAVDTSTRPSPGIFNFGGSSSATSSNNVSTLSTAAPGVFGFGGGSSTSSINSGGTSTGATSGIFNFGGSSSVSSTNAVNGSSTVSPSTFAFGATSASSQTSTPAGPFGSSWQPPKSIGFSPPFSSATPSGFAFGASSSSFTAPSTTTVFGSASSSSSGPAFLFGSTSSTNSPSQPIFGNSISPFTASPANNGHMNMEDSMAEDPVQAASAAVSFGQPSVSPSPGGFVFGQTPSLFQFGGGQQIQPAAQNPSAFAASGSLDFGGGGSFSLGSTGPDKSGRKFIKANRNKNRRK